MADQSNEDVFLAEKVVDSGFGQQDGKRYYKIKWVRYTWESEDTVGHLKELLDAFWAEHERLENPRIKQTDVTSLEIKHGDIDQVNSVENHNGGIVDDNLAATTTVEVDAMLKNEDESNVLQNAHLSDVVTTLSTHQGITEEHSITSVSSQHDGNFLEDNKEVKYIMLEKHTCNICFRTYSSLQSLKTHKRSHQSDKSFQCETCFKCFSERSTLKRHMYIHLEEKPFKCEHCERAFSDKSTLRRHIITHTGAKRFQCNSCDKRFTRNEHLRQHNYIHTAQKLYKCEVCHKDFRQRSTLKNHMLLHRAEGGLKCEACGAVFSRQQQYDKHVRWCNGDTNEGFKCEFCEKRFPERNGLKRHQLIHSGERPFKCDFCEQSFNDRSILRRHVYTHTDRKPFQCSICQKEFIRKESLLSHMSCQHQQSVFEFVHPTGYGINDGMPIEDEELEKHVRYVIQTTASTEVDDVEVSTDDIQNDGVSMLAHAVCNIPQDVMQEASDRTALVSSLNEKNDDNQNQDLVPKSEHQTLRIQVGPESGLQSGDNHLLQVQIIRMEDGNQFVQSIQAIVQEEDKNCESQTLPLDTAQVLHPDVNVSTQVLHQDVDSTQVLHPDVDSTQVLHSDVDTTQVLHSGVDTTQVLHSDVDTTQVLHSDVDTTQVLHSDVGATQVLHPDIDSAQVLHSDINSTQVLHPDVNSSQILHSSVNSTHILHSGVDTTQDLHTDEEMTINETSGVITDPDAMHSHLDISGDMDITIQEKSKCHILENKMDDCSVVSSFDKNGHTLGINQNRT